MITDDQRKGLMSSTTDDWETPQDLFVCLDREFAFTLDVCASQKNAKCERFFDHEQDGLSQSWEGEVCWMNPPYGREIGRWVQKAYEENCTVVCLVPARTDTAWWQDYCMKGEIRFLRGRLRFGGKGHAPFPSAIVVFRAGRPPQEPLPW
jgi:phage N-6-adenine-methyltransferase